jgi:hypothetical protein
MTLGRGVAGLHAKARGHVGRDHFHDGRRFGFGDEGSVEGAARFSMGT